MSATSQLSATVGPDFDAIKTKQQATWAAGDYSAVGVTLQIVGERLCEALDVRAGDSLLDVAAGNGNVSLAAARRFCDVTSTDYVASLLDRGQVRATAEGLPMTFKLADAEALPFDDNSFDHVASSFGVMFTPDQETAASEMRRVCRPGGRIGLANWTPDGFVGQIFKTIGGFVPPPKGLRSPALWGQREHLSTLFNSAVSDIQVTPRSYVFRYRSPDHWLTLWRDIYGPIHKAFQALDIEGQSALAAALTELVDQLNVASDGTMVVPGEYLEVVMITNR